jgi:hypothetical protein
VPPEPDEKLVSPHAHSTVVKSRNQVKKSAETTVVKSRNQVQKSAEN